MIKNHFQNIYWPIIILILIALSAIEAPLFIAFNHKLSKTDLIKDLMISLLFFIDFIFLLIKKIKTKQKGSINFYLLIDLIASIPFDTVAVLFNLSPVITIFRLVRLLCLIKFRKIFAFGNLTVIPWGVKIAFITLFSLIAINLITCGWLTIYPNTSGLSDSSFYIRGLYWSMTTLTTIGYGDITPGTEAGMIYTIVVMILGLGVYGIVIGSFARLFALADRYKEQNLEKLNDLKVFMRHYKIPNNVQKATFSYYNHLFSKRLSTNDTNIIADLPLVLQEELKTYINIKMIQNIPAFHHSSHSCLKQIAKALKQTAYAPNEKIICKGDIGNEMYIIAHGEVDVMDEGKLLTTLTDGQFFGETALIKEVVRTADVISKSYCDLYTLVKEDFINVIKCYPKLLENIKKSTDHLA